MLESSWKAPVSLKSDTVSTFFPATETVHPSSARASSTSDIPVFSTPDAGPSRVTLNFRDASLNLMAHPVRFSFMPTYCSMAALVFLMTAAEATASVDSFWTAIYTCVGVGL